jgi:trehalose-6-phosphate synthase
VIGFHTTEYAANFASFITKYLPKCQVQGSHIIYAGDSTHSFNPQRIAVGYDGPYVMQQLRQHRPIATVSGTRLVVKPLGIDLDHWSNLQKPFQSSSLLSELGLREKQQFILSVDRADYTKSVLERMQIIDKFFDRNPDWKERLSFMQVCFRTRPGLHNYDQYWHKCKDYAEKLNSKWQSESWKPLLWIENSLPADKLSTLYHHATAMLVNPVRDGLNLTAKEFVACQENNPGVLLLSSGAGAWQELGKYALPAHPHEQEETVLSIENALHMSIPERMERNVAMKNVLRKNELKHWWSFFNHQAKTLRRNVQVAPMAIATEEQKASA